MKELCTEIEIQASSEQVWQILADFARFPQWNPFIRRAKGQAKAGARLRGAHPAFGCKRHDLQTYGTQG